MSRAVLFSPWAAPCLCSRSSHAVTLTLLPPFFSMARHKKRRVISAPGHQPPSKGHEKILGELYFRYTLRLVSEQVASMNNFNTFSLFAWERRGVSWRLLTGRWQSRALIRLRPSPLFLFFFSESPATVCEMSPRKIPARAEFQTTLHAYRGALGRAQKARFLRACIAHYLSVKEPFGSASSSAACLFENTI